MKLDIVSCREAVYLALISAYRRESFLNESLYQWKNRYLPSPQDFHLAQEIAYGTMRMTMALDYIAKQIADKKKLSLKLTEKIILRTALYQYYFMDRIPLYAIADESVSIAQKYCYPTFVRFLNAILRKIAKTQLTLPKGSTISDLSVRNSYPSFFVEHLLKEYGLEQSILIMHEGNQPSVTMVRIRSQIEEKLQGLTLVCQHPFPVGIPANAQDIPILTASSDYYIQNATPASLVGNLCQNFPFYPENILDLCASPGGKIIAIHDFFPQAELFANDVSEGKIHSLEENLTKFAISSKISCLDGRTWKSEKKFDVIVLDVPCSNSGVLNKRPEARWRLEHPYMKELEKMQLQLIENASSFLSSKGELWYMTCSILEQENEAIIQKACTLFSLKVGGDTQKILPSQGWDGGFAAVLCRR